MFNLNEFLKNNIIIKQPTAEEIIKLGLDIQKQGEELNKRLEKLTNQLKPKPRTKPKFASRVYQPKIKLSHRKCGISVVDLEWDENTSIEAMGREMARLNKNHRLKLREKIEEKMAESEEFARAVKWQEAEDMKRELQQSTARLTATYNRLPREIKDKIKNKWELAEIMAKEKEKYAHNYYTKPTNNPNINKNEKDKPKTEPTLPKKTEEN